MARFANPGKIERRQWEQWVASRPQNQRRVAERVDPWTLYRMRSTGQRVIFCGLQLAGRWDVLVAVEIAPRFNPVLAGAERVVTTTLENLEPCPLPGPGERVGLFDVQPNPGGMVTEH